MIIKFYRKNVYGKIKYYIAEQHIKEVVKVLTRRETLELEDIKAMEFLGNRFVEVVVPHGS